ncbi:MAG: hypothetical protein II738_01900 [Clostridia bacterium]|nr:hypothetical protein [Clostridia bacterium]
MEKCRRCLLLESAEGDVYREIAARVAALPEAERVPDAVYRERLAACKTCDQLLSGMCLKCGCYVEFRAAFRKRDCPNAADRKWQALA